MKIKLLIGFLLLLTFACKDSNDASESLPKFEGITVRTSAEDILSHDPDDWNLDARFSPIERRLFDTINIDNEWLKSVSSNLDGIVIADDTLPGFYPNPVKFEGYFYPNAPAIANIVIVDQLFNKLVELRTESQMLAFDFSSFDNGIYRLYYVFQDARFKVTGLGYGDILVAESMN